VHSGAVERVRDTLKSVLWHQGQTGGSAAPPLGAIISRVAPVAVRHFSLRHHGHFVPAIERAHSEIRTFTFAHQWYYRYRVHCGRLTDAPLPLQTFLDSVFDGCPNHIFLSTKFSSSRCKTALPIDLAHSADHEIVDIAKRSMAFSGYKARHENLQKYFLDNDPSSLAVEVPLWIEPREFSDYAEIFGTGECLTGHIDLLRVRRGRGGVPARIEVWDYKPNAVKEKYAVTQVFIYAFMLAARTGIALSSFSCGYFDETDAFTFEPGEVGSEIVKEFKYLKK
jgi:hypothetical protein